MGRRLNTFVHLGDEAGERHVFGPGDDLPGWAVDAIVNPDVWEDGPPDRGPAGGGVAETPPPPASSHLLPEDVTTSTGSVVPFPEPPPRIGRGSSTAAWRVYAEAAGLVVPAEAGRDDIIALVDGD